MGEYEDSYPEAYGRGEDKPRSAAEELKEAQSPRQTQDRMSANLRRLGLGTPAQRAMTERPDTRWHHQPDRMADRTSTPADIVEPTAGPQSAPRVPGNFRGVGPRGYLRSPARIYEDICDRLTENAFVDATDIEVSVTGAEVILRGTVDSVVALRQADAIAQEVVGVAQVRNELQVREPAARGTSAGAQINRALGTPHR